MDSDSSLSPGNARRPLLNVCAVLSLIVLGILGSGYFFVHAGPDFQYNRLVGSQYVTFDMSVSLESGGIELLCMKGPSDVPVPTGFQIFWPRFLISGPNLRRSLWGFGGRSLLYINGWRLFLFAFPIWCAALPFLIAPLIWLRKRRKVRDAGFPVVQTSN
jgi:hypothetical protein